MKRRITTPSHPKPPRSAITTSPLDETTSEPLPTNLTQSSGFMLAWVAEISTHNYEQALATLGIKAQHLGILTVLESKGPMVQARLGDLLHIVKPVIVGLINDLEAMKLVERRAHPSDGRAFEIHLLETGVERINQAKLVSEAATASFFKILSPAEQRTFHKMLSRLANDHRGRIALAQKEETL